MYQKLVSFFADGAILNPDSSTDETAPRKTEEQIQALRDLHDTYAHPIKSVYQTNSRKLSKQINAISILKQRENGLINFQRYPKARYDMMHRLLPKDDEVVASMRRPTFCGQFSDDGQQFISACQDYCIRLYDTSSSQQFNRRSETYVEDVGWAILDTALAPNGNQVAYSTWSDCIYLVKLNEYDQQSNIIPLNLEPMINSFSIFSLQFSADGSEIICGSNDTCVYIYDLEKHKRTLRVEAHQNDVNAVRFLDNSNSLIVSGSDDGLVLVWDRRSLKEDAPTPVGIFAGHTSGITFVHSRMDSRYLISNSKDQSIKLWDMRRFANDATIQKSRNASNATNQVWDYRVGAQPQTLQRHGISGDPSVCTYRGHSVGYTLIRCYFSPSFTTGQRYIITGSSDGRVYIYDVLTGKIERCLHIRNNHYGSGREKCVRDVSWHPFDNYIISTSWDNQRAHVRWTYKLSTPSEPCLSPPNDDRMESSPSLNTRDILQRILSQTFSNNRMDLDDDSDTLSD